MQLQTYIIQQVFSCYAPTIDLRLDGDKTFFANNLQEQDY